LKILFHINIDQNKKKQFLSEYINEDIKTMLPSIVELDIYNVKNILEQINKTEKLTKSAKDSLDNIYKNISNPSSEYKSKEIIYRIGTFLKYHILENNKRLLNDSLVFSFNDYIYNSDVNKTVDNMTKV
jgi:hypothetical protein